MAATCKQRVYVRGSYMPFEEDETHEFKGHREIAPEDTPPWAFRHPTESQSRKAISRNLNAFLNTGLGGVVYCGVDDRGRVLGLHLTRYQKDHMLLSVRCLLMRYRPAVPSARYRVTFVPVVSSAEVDDPPAEFAYDVSRRTKQHLVATSHYCWCDADARARSVSGIIPLSYVIEIEILPWADRDKALHPFYLTESGQCYVRRQASIMPAAALIRRQSEQMALQSQRDISALQARLDSGLLSKVRANIGKFIDVSEAFGSAGLNGRQYELDSDDSEDSWDAEYQPEHRLVASLSDGATVV
ncbi:Schlafen-like protein 1 [Amphibalanus amphitrite]|uniref:Schlafen-like protein 1 n=1 Tax=Amphibalanus amphitrite TaxID=1232801 RepID=A0A6A4VJ56_AMPAM|nr:Schlafen-like protein 1 [Amphibalanus amphitrite]